jgi:hypothetical protein
MRCLTGAVVSHNKESVLKNVFSMDMASKTFSTDFLHFTIKFEIFFKFFHFFVAGEFGCQRGQNSRLQVFRTSEGPRGGRASLDSSTTTEHRFCSRSAVLQLSRFHRRKPATSPERTQIGAPCGPVKVETCAGPCQHFLRLLQLFSSRCTVVQGGADAPLWPKATPQPHP